MRVRIILGGVFCMEKLRYLYAEFLFCLLLIKEVSYEPAPEALPPQLPTDLECVLLTVYLSSNAGITAHKPGGGNARSIDNSE